MADNPIKYSDLILPDDSIEKLVQQLTEANNLYMSLAENIKKEAQQMQSSLKGLAGTTEENRQRIKDSATESDRLAKEYKKLEQAMDKNAKEIARLNIARRQMTNYQKQSVLRGKEEIRTMEQIKNASYQQLSAQYALNKAYINQLTAKERNIKKNRELIESTRQMYEQMKHLQEATGKHQLNVGNYGSALGGVGLMGLKAATGIGSLAAAGTMAVSALKDGVGTAMDFEAAVSKLSAILGVGKDEMTELVEQARQLGATTIFTAQEVAELQTELAKLGYGQQEIKNMTKDVLLFAQATGSSLADAASLAGASLRMFEKDTQDTQDFVDKMAASTNKSALSFSFLQNAMSTVSPVANAFGFKIEDTLALLGQLANAGFDASSAATATRNILLNLADTNGVLAKSLGKPVTNLDELITGLRTLNEGGIDLATSLELTDKRSVAAFQTFLKGADNVLQLRDALNNADGTAQQMAKTMGDNLSGDVKSLSSAWEDFMININNGQGILRTAVQGITTLVRKLSEVWSKMRDYFSEMYDNSMAFRYVVEGLTLQWKTFFGVVEFGVKKLWNELKAIGHLVKGIFTLDMDEIKTAWKMGVTDVIAGSVNAVERLRDGYKNAVKTVINGRKQIAKATKQADAQDGTTTTTTTGTKGGFVKPKSDKELAAQRKAAEKAEKEKVEAAKRSLQIQRAYDDALIALIENDADRERAVLVTKYNREIEDLEFKLKTEKKLTEQERKNINDTIILLEQQKADKLADLVEKQAIEQMELEKKAMDMRNSGGVGGTALQAQLESLEKQKEIEVAKNRITEKGRLDEKDIIAKYEREKQKLVYDYNMDMIDKQADLRQLEIENMETSEYEKNRLSIEAEKARLKAIYDLNIQAGKDLSSLEMRTLQEQMKKLDQEAQKNKKNRDIFDLMGFNLTDEKKEAISTSFQFAMDQLSNYMNAWVQAAEAKAQLAEQEVERAQNVLDAEIEARNQGYASDVETARKELELAKSNQQKALKEKEKAQKAQLALQTVEQAANLITATSLIWSQLGFPWAIPAIAVMWGSFAAAKIKALEATKSGSEEYGEGTVELLDGGSHQSGNDVDLGRKKDGTRRRAEGGEFFAVINKRNSRKYRNVIPDIINSLNAGTFEQKYAHAYDGADAIAFNVQQGNNPDLRGLSSDVRAIREQGDRQSFTDSRGTHVVYKNLHRIYKN